MLLSRLLLALSVDTVPHDSTHIPSPAPTPYPTPYAPYVPLLRKTTPADNAQAVSKELKQLVLAFDDTTPVRKGVGLLLLEQFDQGEGEWAPFLNVSLNSSRVRVAPGGRTVTVALQGLGGAAEAKSPFRFATYYQVRTSQRGALRALDARGTRWGGIGGSAGAADRWTFKVEPEPVLKAGALTQNSTLANHRVEMWGVGVFVLDVGAIDLKGGTFYADLVITLLRYYRTFDTPEDAVKEATIAPPPGGGSGGGRSGARVCNTLSGESSHWTFFSNVSSALITDKLDFINIGRFPKFKPHFKRGEDSSSPGGGGALRDDHSPPPLHDPQQVAGDTLDHIRLQSDFYFAPALAEYPFNTQNLTLKLEISGASLEVRPRYLMCALPRFSGFASELSSFRGGSAWGGGGGGGGVSGGGGGGGGGSAEPAASSRAPRAPLEASFDIAERAYWPPNAGITSVSDLFHELVFPQRPGSPRSASRQASRLHFVITYDRGRLLGLLQLAPALFIGVTALAGFALPFEEYKGRLTAVSSALLAAIVQHSSIRSGIAQQNIVTFADLVMAVVYLLILTSFISTVVVAVLHNSFAYRAYAQPVHAACRLLALSELLLLGIFTFDNPSGLTAWISLIVTVLLSWISLMALDRLRYERERRVGAELSAQLRPVQLWTVPEVRAWLLHCPLGGTAGGGSDSRGGGRRAPFTIAVAERRQYAHALAQHLIDGPALVTLSLGDVRSMGVPLGHAMKLHSEVKRLCKHGLALPPSPRPRDASLRSDESEGSDSDGGGGGGGDSGEVSLLRKDGSQQMGEMGRGAGVEIELTSKTKGGEETADIGRRQR